MLLTVFTSTYNRAYILSSLYDSLLTQTNLDFEWLIVDDGSTDDTESLVSGFIRENRLTIRYLKQANKGKHVAINHGISVAKGELFFIVDSDDKLPSDSIETITMYYKEIETDESFIGICGLKGDFSNRIIGGDKGYEVLDCTPLEFRIKYKMKGDVAEVLKTEIFKRYLFPEFEGEAFCPEALVWNRFTKDNYKIRYFNKLVYLCEYLPDGLTAKSVKIRMNNPSASMLYYSELYKMPIPFLQKVKATVNFWRFSFKAKDTFCVKLHRIGCASLLLLPVGALFHLNDLRR